MIPVCEPTFFGKEKDYAIECLETNWISSNGRFIELFEKSFSDFIGTKYGMSCSNGTTALHLAMETLGIGKGDEVIVPNLSNIATINSVIFSGAKPVLVDVEKDTFGIDPEKIKDKITKKTKAINLVHLYGHPVDMGPIMEIVKKNDIFLIEDCAEAHGAEYKGKKVGSFGDLSCFSLYSNKIVTTGEGGIVLTNNEEYAEKANLIKNLGFTEPRFHHWVLGTNYRMTNIQAAIGLGQMENIDKILSERDRIKMTYDGLLKDVKNITLQKQAPWAKMVCWMYCILLEPEFKFSKDELMNKLKAKGIETRSFFYPFHRQPLFLEGEDERYPCCDGDYPVSDELSSKGLYLPSGSSLSENEMETVVEELIKLGEQK